MLTLKDETGKAYGALAEVAEKNGVNGERSLSGTIYSNDDVIHGVDRGWSINWKNEVYKVIYAEPIDNGETVELQFDAVHQFFYDMKKSVVDGALNDGSHTMRAYLDFIFNGSGYRYNLELDVAAFEKENFGYKNRLDLFNDIVSQTGVEFTVSGANVRIISQVGQDLSSIVKKGFNLNELKIEKNIDNFVTYKRGYGAWHDEEDHSKGRVQTEYLSPLHEVYGVLEDDPVVDERYTVVSNLQNRLKHEVDNSYTLSVGLNMEALIEAGYGQKQPRAGDYIMAINDDLGFKRKVRIVSYVSQYDIHGRLVDHEVECNSVGVVQRQTGNQNRLNQAIAETRRQVQAAQANALQARVSADGKKNIYYGHEEPSPEVYKLSQGDIWFSSEHEDVIQYVWNGAEWRRASFDREQFNRIISDQTAKLNAFTTEIEAVRERNEEELDNFNKQLEDFRGVVDDFGVELEGLRELDFEAFDAQLTELEDEIELLKEQGVKQEDIDEAIANAGFSRQEIRDIRRQLNETTYSSELALEMIGSDGAVRYSKNRVDGATSGEIEFGGQPIHVAHNGEGFKAGQTYTISFSALCELLPQVGIDLRFNYPSFVERTLTVHLEPEEELLDVIEGEAVSRFTSRVFKGFKYKLTINNDWYKTIKEDIELEEDLVQDFELVFREIVKGDVTSKRTFDWNEEADSIFESSL